LSDPFDEYVNLILDDFRTHESLRKKVVLVHLEKADKALEKCINHLFKAADLERINLYRLLCYLGSRIDEIKKGRPIWRRQFKNEYWGYIKFE
jgi:hypothetical protein